tara:strand:+ start:83 stop:781 length:699 start_codon:yes stop_codon:yes gene_type:complete
MKKIFVVLFIIGIFLTISGVFAQTDLSEELNDFVKKVAEKKGIDETEITDVTEVDFSNLPNEVKIENIDDINIALYKIDSENNRSTFIITYSDKGFKKIPIQDYYTTSLLHFGIGEEMNDSVFLKTNTGVSGDLNKGYVMLRKGSITGISTNLEAIKGSGEIQIIIYKNNERIGFGNLVDISDSGIKKDYDIQSRDIVEFEQGDIISVYVKIQGEITWKDAITMIEISTLGN